MAGYGIVQSTNQTFFFLFTLNECTHNEKEIALMHLMAIKYHVYNVFLCN